jgi:hypothetical protein
MEDPIHALHQGSQASTIQDIADDWFGAEAIDGAGRGSRSSQSDYPMACRD